MRNASCSVRRARRDSPNDSWRGVRLKLAANITLLAQILAFSEGVYLRQIVQREIERRALPASTDTDLALDVLYGPLYH